MQIQDYYKNNSKDFKLDDRVKWQHLFVSAGRFNTPEDTKLYAEWLMKTAATSTDVPALAKQYGHGDSALRNGEGSGKGAAGSLDGASLPAELFQNVPNPFNGVTEIRPDAIAARSVPSAACDRLRR